VARTPYFSSNDYFQIHQWIKMTSIRSHREHIRRSKGLIYNFIHDDVKCFKTINGETISIGGHCVKNYM